MGDHWFQKAASHMGEAYLRYSFTKGTEQEVQFLIKQLDLVPGMRLLDVGCGPGRHAHLFAKAGIEVVGIDISKEFIDIASSKEINGTKFLNLDARSMTFDKEFDVVVSLCQGAFGLAGKPTGPVAINDPDGAILERMSKSLSPGGKIALTAFSAYFQVRYLEEQDTFHADHGVNHEVTSIKNSVGKELIQDLWTSCFTPRELRLLATKYGLTVESIWSVSPGRYGEFLPTHTKPEFMLIARR